MNMPYLQIEQVQYVITDVYFVLKVINHSNKKSGFMGTMNLDLFKSIIDKAVGNIEFYLSR